MLLTPVTVFNLFSKGLAINLEVSPGEAPSRNTDTEINGSCTFGDAAISEKHCNFFVNKGNAKFEDMKNLIEFVADCVFKKTGIRLEKEIKILE